MEVILKEDVNNLGHRGDVVKVADGYGRNYLLPKKLAMEANAANKAVIEQMKASAVRRSAKEKGFNIDRRKVHLEEPLKQVGEFHVPVKLHREVTAHVAVTVKGEEAAAE